MAATLAYLPKKGRRADRLVGQRSEATLIYRALGRMSGVTLTGGYLQIPAEPRVFDALLDAGLVPTEEATAWYERATEVERSYIPLVTATDATVNHPAADRLRPYQRVGAQFVCARGRSLLAEDMGLGKTAEAIVGIETSKEHRKILVVCPNAVKYQWEDEIHKWSADGEDAPTTVVIAKTLEKQWKEYTAGWFILNYNNFRSFSSRVGESVVTKLDIPWDWLVLDEGHALKNRKTRGYATARSVLAKNAVIITGTPMGNDATEIWALLSLLYPKEYRSYWRFYELYTRYTEDYFGRRELLGVKNPHLLRRDLSTRVLRRTKEEVAPDLPEKTHVRIELDLTDPQISLYKRAMNEWMIDLGHEAEVLPIANTLSMLVRLRQIVSTPANFGLPAASSKISACIELIKSTDQQVVVFTCFRRTAQEIAKRLKAEGIHGGLLMGGFSAEERREVVASLTRGSIQVIAATIKAGGTGLNLQAASIAIFIDKEWNPLEQAQAEDRVHRIGQKVPVTIYSLACPGTVDDIVDAILDKKIAMTAEVLQESLARAAQAAKLLSLPRWNQNEVRCSSN